MFDYKPVLRVKRGSYKGAALIGTYSAVIGWSFDDPTLRKGLKGFAIRRTKYHKASEELLEVKWLGGV